MAQGDAREGKWRGNWRMEWVASTLTPPPKIVYPALLKLMCTPRLPAVDWTDAPTDLNGLVRFGERRNLVSALVSSRSARAIPHSMLQPTSGQQVHTNCSTAPIQHHMVPPIQNYPSEDYVSQQSQRKTSTREEEEETHNSSKNEWQVMRRTKRKKIHRTQQNTTQHNTTKHDTAQHNTTRHDTTWYDTTQHDTTRHDTTWYDTTRHDTTRHNTTQHNTTQHNTTQHDTKQHNTTWILCLGFRAS